MTDGKHVFCTAPVHSTDTFNNLHGVGPRARCVGFGQGVGAWVRCIMMLHGVGAGAQGWCRGLLPGVAACMPYGAAACMPYGVAAP